MQDEPDKSDSRMAMKHDATSGFVCRQCGQCCREPGYVYLTTEDVDRIAAFLGLDIQSFTERFTRLPPERRGLSLNENEDQSCVFLNEQGQCAIQAVKPLQCELFPHNWRYKDMQTVCAGWDGAAESRKQKSES